MAQGRTLEFGVRGSLGLSAGDLKDTSSTTNLGVGGFIVFPTGNRQAIQARLDGVFFQSAHRQGSGSTNAIPWVRNLDTKVQAFALGAEYLVQPLAGDSRFRFGAGLHVVRWSMNSTSTLNATAGGATSAVSESGTPAWTKLGVSVLASYQFSLHLGAEVRMFSSSYGWEGERVQIGQFGLTWTF